MKLSSFSTLISALTVAAMLDLIGIAKPAAASSIQLIGLNDNNTLVFFNTNSSTTTGSIGVTGVTGTLLGIDFRPADGLLYGLTSTNNIYTIDPTSGAATFVSSLTTAFTAGLQSGVDFNPVPDRLRLVGTNEQNLRTNVDTGAVIIDGTLAYAAGDGNVGADPSITAAAYANNIAGVTTTTLYGIDSALDILVRQAPPNAGTLNTIGTLGIDFGDLGGFDIFTDEVGDTAFAASGSTFYNIDLLTGAATTIGTTSSGGSIVGLAARSVPEPTTTGSLIGFGTLALIGRYRRRVKSHN